MSEREDYADPPAGPSALMGLAWLATLFLALTLMAFAIAIAGALMFAD